MQFVQTPGRVFFRMLGTLEVIGDDAPLAPELTARPKALALLAFLALESRQGTCTRDTILAHFWPDSTMAAARHALRQALYELRQALGANVLETRGQHDVAVNREELVVDAVELQDALDAGRVEDALDLYVGELLPGLHFADAPPEFEAWLDEAREGLRRRLTESAWSAFRAAEASGDVERAIRVGRRVAELDPYQEPGVRRVMELLHEAGRSAEAIHLFRRLRHRLANELDLCCSPETEALAARIAAAAGPAPRSDFPDALPAEDPAGTNPAPVELVAPPHPGPGVSPVQPVIFLRTPRAPRLRFLAAGTLVVAVAGMTAVAGLVMLRSAAVGRAMDDGLSPEVAQFFEPPVVGAPGTGARLILGPIESPDRTAAVAVASALTWTLSGQDVGVGGHLSGRISPVDGGWEIDATLERPDGAVRIAAMVPGDLAAVARQLGSAVAAALDLSWAGREALLPANEQALRAHVQGEWLLERGEVHAAAEAFQRATRHDPAFALAHYRLSVAASIGFDAAIADRAEATALALQARMPEPEALIVEARRAYRTGEPDVAESLLRSVLDMSPGHPEAGYHAAEVLFHYNPLRGRPLAEARPALERAAARNIGRAEALYHVVQTSLLMGDLATFDRAATAVLELGPGGFRTAQVRALRAHVLGSGDDWRRELAGLTAARDIVVLSTAHNVAVYHGDLPAALEVLEILTRPDREPGVRARAHAARADLLAAAGRPTDVAVELGRAMEIDPLTGASRAASLLTLGVLPPDDPGLQAVAREILEGGPRPSRTTSNWVAVETALDPWLDPHARVLAALALGDPAPARLLIQQLLVAGLNDRSGGILLADLSLKLRPPASGAALDRTAFSMRGITPEEATLSPLFSRPLARLAQGYINRDVGRLRQADRWFASLLEHSLPDLALAAIALGERARTADLLGDAAGAQRFRERLERLHESAEDGYLRWRDRQPWAPLAPTVAMAGIPTD
jgi:DNA-binding SARP family transcriptional activator